MALNFLNNGYFAGEVGIGTDAPFSKLSINSNGVPIFTAAQMATTGLTIHNGTTGTAVQIGTYDAGAYNYIQSGYVNSASTGRELRFYNGAVNSLKLSATGDATFAGDITVIGQQVLGSGGTANLYLGNEISPSSSDKGARFHSSNNDFYLDFQGDATQTWYLRDYDGSGGTHTRFTFDFINGDFTATGDLIAQADLDVTGTIGIGTAPTTNAIEIDGADGTSYVFFKSVAATTGARVGLNGDDLIIENKQASGDTIFDTNSTERMRIDSAGNVGIGTDDPDALLHAAGTTLPEIRVQDLSGTDQYTSIGHNGGNATYLSYNDQTYGGHQFMSRKTAGAGTGTAIRLQIDSTGAIAFNAYDSTNNIGTPTYILGTDASGNVVKVLGGSIPGGGGTVTGTGTADTVTKWSTGGTGIEDGPITFSTNDSTFTGNILIGNTVVNPASGFADQTGIGLKYSTTVPQLEVSSDSIAVELGRTSTGGEGQILALRKAGTVIHSFSTNAISIGTDATFAGNLMLYLIMKLQQLQTQLYSHIEMIQTLELEGTGLILFL